MQLAEKIRFEKELEMLEDRKSYRLKKENESNFLQYFRNHRDNEAFTVPVQKSYKYVLPMDAILPDMVLGFTNYLRKKCTGEGSRKNYHWFKKVVADAMDKDLIKKKTCRAIRIVYDTNVVLKEILSPK